jgi:L-asparaginase
VTKIKIALIQTGGTIDKDYPKSTKGWAFEIHDPAFKRILKKINPSFEYELVTAFKKDSLEITEEDRSALHYLIEESECEKVIVTHGTDTMAETAKFLSNKNTKTVIITGAMRPERFANTDADVNLGMALAAVQTLPAGVFICMHGLVIPANKIGRDMKTGQYLKIE